MTSLISERTSGRSGARGRLIQPGETRSPNWSNRYTSRRSSELIIERLLKGELGEEEAEALAAWVSGCVSSGMTPGEALATVAVQGALRGEGKHFDEVLKRIWPVTEKRPVAGGRVKRPPP